MSKIHIEWLDDWNESCETCGPSYAEGARITVDGIEVLYLEPVAHCHAGASYGEKDVFMRLLAHLGHEVSVAV